MFNFNTDWLCCWQFDDETSTTNFPFRRISVIRDSYGYFNNRLVHFFNQIWPHIVLYRDIAKCKIFKYQKNAA